MAQPRIGLLAVGFGSLDQTLKLSAGRRAFGCVAKQPVLSSDVEGPDRMFGSVVDRQVTFLDVPFQFDPVNRQITDGFAQGVLRRYLRLRLFYPAFNRACTGRLLSWRPV